MTVIPKKGAPQLMEDAPPLKQEAAELTRAYGDHALAFFGLALENEHFLAPEGKGLVNYRLVQNVAVVPGDPLCTPEAREEVTRSFLEFCAAQGWSAAFYQASAVHLPVYRALKLGALKMGEEALIHPQTFTLQGSALANVRTSCRRAERAGVTLDWYEGIPSAEVMHQLRLVSDRWFQDKAGERREEMGFSMGRLDDLLAAAERAESLATCPQPQATVQPAVPRLVIAIARESSGQPCAFVTFTPIYGCERGASEVIDAPDRLPTRGWALDLLRRIPDAPPGVMDLLLVRSIERFGQAGARCVSLGLVVWAESRPEKAAVHQPLTSLLTDRLGMFASRQSLYKFKQKFRPTWESRYLVVSTPLAWPLTFLALLRLRNYTQGFARVLRWLTPFLRYCLVGGVNTLLDLLAFNVLLWAFPTTNGFELVAYNALAYTSGALSGFFLNKYWTFRHARKATWQEVGRFVLILLLELLTSSTLVWLAGQALRPFLTNAELWGNVSKLLALAIGALFSYLFLRYWVFSAGSRKR